MSKDRESKGRTASKAVAHLPKQLLQLQKHGSEGTIPVEANYKGEDLGTFIVGRAGIEHNGKRRGWRSLAKFLADGKRIS